jgi:hypothetical protein
MRPAPAAGDLCLSYCALKALAGENYVVLVHALARQLTFVIINLGRHKAKG